MWTCPRLTVLARSASRDNGRRIDNYRWTQAIVSSLQIRHNLPFRRCFASPPLLLARQTCTKIRSGHYTPGIGRVESKHTRLNNRIGRKSFSTSPDERFDYGENESTDRSGISAGNELVEITTPRSQRSTSSVGMTNDQNPPRALTATTTSSEDEARWRQIFVLMRQHYEPSSIDQKNGGPESARPVRSLGGQENASRSSTLSTEHETHEDHDRRWIGFTSTPPQAPEIWTSQSLLRYISALASYKPPRPGLSMILPAKYRHDELQDRCQVMNFILSLIEDDGLRNCITSEICEVALGGFLKRPHLEHLSRLYARMDRLNIAIPTAGWNRMLSVYAAAKDLDRFGKLLWNMILAHGRPDPTTFSLFITAVQDLEVRRDLIALMRQEGGLSHLKAASNIAACMARHDLAEFLSTRPGRDFSPFFDRLQQNYGPHCLHAPLAGNRMLGMVLNGQYGRKTTVISALQLLRDLKRYGFRPNEQTLRLFFRQCQGDEPNRIYLHMMVLDNWATLFSNPPGPLSHQLLFGIARRHQHLNMLRVVWASACVNGFVTAHMQKFMQRSLMSRSTRRKPWTSTDKFDFHHIASFFALSLPIVPIKTLGKRQLGVSLPRADVIKLQAQAAVAFDLATFNQASLKGGLINLLRRAAAFDQELERRGLWKRDMSETDILKMRITIPITSPPT